MSTENKPKPNVQKQPEIEAPKRYRLLKAHYTNGVILEEGTFVFLSSSEKPSRNMELAPEIIPLVTMKDIGSERLSDTPM